MQSDVSEGRLVRLLDAGASGADGADYGTRLLLVGAREALAPLALADGGRLRGDFEFGLPDSIPNGFEKVRDEDGGKGQPPSFLVAGRALCGQQTLLGTIHSEQNIPVVGSPG